MFSVILVSALILSNVVATATALDQLRSYDDRQFSSIASSQEGTSVVELQQETLANAISDRSQDILLYAYSPTCGPCKRFSPIYQQLASFYTSEEQSNKILISQIDGTQNDLPFKVVGYPQIMLYSAKADSSPLEYVVQKLDISAALGIAKFVETESVSHLPVPNSLVLAHAVSRAASASQPAAGVSERHEEL
ncbi:Protein disulfide-isomerase [Cyphellophora attinorum]|uniref:Protein disulfide-isomerase n=1 Tax=Cyphellophora attinorum TaxID=1664694 RepID=A0A0N1H3T4_9EURO|nr:Protein disulfide-isomerase [Phialophora attinorum]KPI35620.1 Protein disulfide-isomerase [Phialophora attinorum]